MRTTARGPAVAETTRREALPQTPQSRKVTASQRGKVRALGLTLLLLLLAIGPQARKVHKSPGAGKDHPGLGMNHTGAFGIHIHQVGIGVDTDERNVTTSLELTAVAETFVYSQLRNVWQSSAVGVTTLLEFTAVAVGEFFNYLVTSATEDKTRKQD